MADNVLDEQLHFGDEIEVSDVVEEQTLDDVVDKQILCHELLSENVVVAEQLLGLEHVEEVYVVDRQLHRLDSPR